MLECSFPLYLYRLCMQLLDVMPLCELRSKTVLQGNPFLHNRFYLELLKQPALLGAVQTMSLVYLEDGGPAHTTPMEVC